MILIILKSWSRYFTKPLSHITALLSTFYHRHLYFSWPYELISNKQPPFSLEWDCSLLMTSALVSSSQLVSSISLTIAFLAPSLSSTSSLIASSGFMLVWHQIRSPSIAPAHGYIYIYIYISFHFMVVIIIITEKTSMWWEEIWSESRSRITYLNNLNIQFHS